ncbi:UDP-4-amino-4,6-dideoxy-N-acetyl-beta-L-altrosamine transaminase [candidate division WOR-1 bacterium RIFOXYB2_FULL_42_35]|uniref:UDP-4-amino-4, 6-dideoxy-N-acetyl-beta-L-altrosamine transaminase n=1 Tax=candidate division WOR-1 bacterium RIFOXYC2_FULL_41_25 TaxID=1802586 RepID=A0A1F4TP06_UNCSA|nr:MAG: UDP-4-amino-4,6-dideoxy-N-acetyl-beta-L-altrosamine transaminase [candidate division WOR-1 bacterium RIFOXYA2_FULL_41_14]OGC24116.1 MAG: UDP-4-amino-4,6-dideoxy-N-acetyl-beta-L-altrosamine transaminase [candidate division WOR-1 bacterium RIFOXYB2_FULL_42_35]OGC33803.1 MAG: UDP-4-amino-4,6-dideoxy-N-acetyl-beta-L-altrosamine transaminase [candidate division WOR-1 bacterium RIFOXYC2_FULL_41_25]OGC43698.1 MAG: UDP-4-amino-4,6-dideoxy-N-acetyl-beta-L-altrosamine transaminase [candidate divis
MAKKLIPYATQWVDEDDIAAVVAALGSSNLTQGPRVLEFEEKMAAYCGAKYAVAVNSGTSALHLACLAAGISFGDEVITSPITFVASANCVLYCGAKPVFADVQEDIINIDSDEVRKKIGPKTKALIPVHFSGNPCEMEKINALAKENKLLVIEDASHALGAKYQGQMIGSGQFSDLTVFSFHAVKHIAIGEGGMVLTNNKDLYEKLLLYRSHGITRDRKDLNNYEGDWFYEMHSLGYNFRLTDIQSALGISQLNKLDAFVDRRKEISRRYHEAFADFQKVKVLVETDGAESSYHLFVILVEDRKTVFYKLREAGIMVNVHYLPIYLQPYYRQLGYLPGLCPVAEGYYKKTLSLPMYPKLSDQEVDFVIDTVKDILLKERMA